MDKGLNILVKGNILASEGIAASLVDDCIVESITDKTCEDDYDIIIDGDVTINSMIVKHGKVRATGYVCCMGQVNTPVSTEETEALKRRVKSETNLSDEDLNYILGSSEQSH